ncbi:MAG: tetratricopeptide repeat protein [Oscillospiraceae bacterium]|nr:tetratricopeptide repeat protein [Oscillospiraceae bacterium]
MNTGKKLLIGVMAAVILLAVLSLTLLNRHSSQMRMSALMREGRLAMDAHDYAEAIDLYRLAISLDGRSVEAYMRLASACILNGDLEDAKYFLELGLRKTESPRLREAYNEFLGNLAVEERGEEGGE